MKVLILGMGKTGLSFARFLLRQDAGDNWCATAVEAVDTRPNPPLAAEMRALLGAKNCHAGEDFRTWPARRLRRFDHICVSPGAPRDAAMFSNPSLKKTQNSHLARAAGELSILSDAFGGVDSRPASLMITGTNGKSTVAALTAALCRASGVYAQVVGNFGFPLLDAWRQWHGGDAPWENLSAHQISPPAVAVMELSSFQLQYAPSAADDEAPRFRAHAAAVLNVSPDHLDYHKDLGEYAEVKSRIYDFAEYGVINLDDPRVVQMGAARKKNTLITFSAQQQKADWYVDGGDICGGDMRFSRRKISPALTVENVLAGLALFSSLLKSSRKTATRRGVLAQKPSAAALAQVLAGFPGLPHRMQKICAAPPFDAIDDSKSTNVASACFALQHIRGDIILIAGGDGKGQDFSPLAAACRPATIKHRAIKKVLLFGKDASVLYEVLRGDGVPCEVVANMKAAVGGAAKIARQGDKVLLSPACSSLDMYQDYAARGDDFAAACRALQTTRKERCDAA